ncbi:YnbE family lipoprotein [Photobacterium carnosum]|jgi:lipoprotein NlpI|uniref:YnbE family lipoprotein n=1 Tax=Photobacterium carnosum TaxID=2023717 RepID=UPI001E2E7ECC|nr:YnbE family lipoprotein [Photobacterium carnosum]MCD9543283.1 YnbE family lipoprotein [Photobacterium carnosum]
MNRLQKAPLRFYSIIFFIAILSLGGCTPTIQVATSDKPIEINLNINIEHEIKIKVDKDIEQLFDNKAVF